MTTSRATLFRIMRFLYAAWILGESTETISPIPTDTVIWSHALAGLKARGHLPPEVADHLTFVNGPTGLECLEVPTILAMACESGIIPFPDSFSPVDRIGVSKNVARKMVARLELDPLNVASFGYIFRSALMQGYLDAKAA
jgi:hypothetical protein